MMHYYYSAMRQSSWHRTASRIRRKRLSGNADEGNRAAHAAIHAVENAIDVTGLIGRSEEHTSELQSLMRISYADLCLNKKKLNTTTTINILRKLKTNQY